MPGPQRGPVEKPKDIKVSARLFLKSLKPFRGMLIFACLLVVGSTVLGLFGPNILGQMTTDAVTSLGATGGIDWGPIARGALTLILLYTLSGICSYFNDFLIGRVAARYAQKMRSAILAKINRLPIAYFDQHQFGDTLSRMTNDVDTVSQSLQTSLSQIISSVVMIVGVLIMMFLISPLLSLIALVAVPFSTVFIGEIAGRAQKFFSRQQSTLGKLNSKIEEDYAGQLVIQSNSHEAVSTAEFREVNNALYTQAWKAQFYSSMAFPITHMFTNLSYVAICVAGGYQVISGQISIGSIQAFLQYVSQFNRPITQVAQIVSTIQQTLAASERIQNFLGEEEEGLQSEILASTTRPSGPSPWSDGAAAPAAAVRMPSKLKSRPAGRVHFDQVNFGYGEEPTIEGFSGEVEPGQMVALVGPTGAGKTTMVNLLMRFYDPDSGRILIDGVDTKTLSRDEVRSMFGMVLQDTWLFSGTVEENLKYGNPQATHAQIVKACKEANVHHFIESLPHGYRTKISEDSDNISAGEKQLLTIARAMIAKPAMMILDEATSNVDTRTEQLIQDALGKLSRGRTSFVIAHRLSTIRNADLIIVMNHGKIVEQGNHEQLLKKGGFYADLYNSQFAES